MKASELIGKLIGLIAIHGDLPIYCRGYDGETVEANDVEKDESGATGGIKIEP